MYLYIYIYIHVYFVFVDLHMIWQNIILYIVRIRTMRVMWIIRTMRIIQNIKNSKHVFVSSFFIIILLRSNSGSKNSKKMKMQTMDFSDLPRLRIPRRCLMRKPCVYASAKLRVWLRNPAKKRRRILSRMRKPAYARVAIHCQGSHSCRTAPLRWLLRRLLRRRIGFSTMIRMIRKIRTIRMNRTCQIIRINK